jgi:hypothetical protein
MFQNAKVATLIHPIITGILGFTATAVGAHFFRAE